MNPSYAGIGVFSLEIIYFKLAFELGSVSAAARKIGQDASNLSRLISRLERRAGMALFVRHRAGLQPTTEGERFYRAVTRAEEQFFRGLGRQSKRPIRIGFASAVGFSHFAPRLLDALVRLQADPDFAIETSGSLLERIQQRSIDFVVVATDVRTPGLISRRLSTEGIALCSRTGKTTRILAVNPDLLSVETIVRTIRHEERWAIRDYFVLAKFVEEHSDLMALLPETLLRSFPRLKLIRRFPRDAKMTALSWPGSPGVALMRALHRG